MNIKERHDEAEKEYRAELVKQLEVIGEPLLEGEVIDISADEEKGPWLETDHRAIPTGEWLDYYYGMVKEEGRVKLLLVFHPNDIGYPLDGKPWVEELEWTGCTCIKNLEALITALNETKGNL